MALVSFQTALPALYPQSSTKDSALALHAALVSLRLSVVSLVLSSSNTRRIQHIEQGASAVHTQLARLQQHLGELRVSHERIAVTVARCAAQLEVHDAGLRVHARAIEQLAGRRARVDLIIDALSVLLAAGVAATARAPLYLVLSVLRHALFSRKTKFSVPVRCACWLSVAGVQALVCVHAARAIRAQAARFGVRSTLPTFTAGPMGAATDFWVLLFGSQDLSVLPPGNGDASAPT